MTGAEEIAKPTDWGDLLFDREWAAEADRLFFELHPDRYFRVREALPGEFGMGVDLAPIYRGAVLLVIAIRDRVAIAKQVISCRGLFPDDEDHVLAELVLPRGKVLH